MVVDLSQSNPPGWPAPRPFKGRKPTDAVLYEIHVRDLTSHPNSGVPTELRGRYLGIVEKGMLVPGTDFATGFDYLKDLGVTHVQLMPMQNFNPAHSGGYNWGYETTLFNVPEEQYAVQRDIPLSTLRETKRLFMDLQRAGMSVVMDVVYNHTVPSEGEWSAFWQTVPYYYFRNNDRGDNLNESGVGNAVHDERPMVRKYIRESLVFWLKEYRVDGFGSTFLACSRRKRFANWPRLSAWRTPTPWLPANRGREAARRASARAPNAACRSRCSTTTSATPSAANWTGHFRDSRWAGLWSGARWNGLWPARLTISRSNPASR